MAGLCGFDMERHWRPPSDANRSVHSSAMKWLNQALAAVLILIGATWGRFAFGIIWNTGDHMIGFHPLILLGIPAASVFGIAGVVATRRKSWLLAVSSFVASLFVIAPLLAGPRIIESAWINSLKLNSEANRKAIQETDFTDSTYLPNWIPDVTTMTAVHGFQWYCTQHIAAPNGDFRGFMIGSVPHVYVQKVRNGFRGVAWLGKQMSLPDGDIKYRYSGVGNWYIWTY
ncbi:MAG: hypothetical protein KDB23_23330 [Planctomycetales bacterium]|nr:hypothetical protein [Planctomycetales bacterium]